MSLDVNAGIVAAICGLIGSAITKLIEVRKKKLQYDFQSDADLKTELFGRLDKLEVELREVRAEVDLWKDKYYTDTHKLKTEISGLKLESEIFKIHLRDIKNKSSVH